MASAADTPAAPSVELLVIGDVHGDWDDVDRAFLEQGRQDAAVFVGDFGDEDVALVATIAALRCVKAVMLGNHDAWWSMSGKDTARVEKQLELLGAAAIGYSHLPVAGGSVLLVGGRPFSWGGGWGRHRAFYQKLYNVGDEVESTGRIVHQATSHPRADLVLVGHNGPRGLGEGAGAIFGCDFRVPHGDWGDADLRHALDRLRGEGRRVVATLAGHMHDRLRFGGQRQRASAEGGTLHLNAAVVPRHRATGAGRLRHYLRVALQAGVVREAEDLWVDDRAAIAERESLLPAMALL